MVFQSAQNRVAAERISFQLVPSWMCDRRSCSPSVSFAETLAAPAAFFFAIFHVHSRGGLALRFALVEALGTRFGSRPHTVAKAETTGCAQAFRRAFDWQQRCRLR